MLGDAELLASAEMSERLEKEGGDMEAAIESGRELLGIPAPARPPSSIVKKNTI